MLKKGRPGKGHQGGYKTFCRFCFREFPMDGVDICTVCGKETMTLEERMDELKTKLEEHK
jgi:rRNA maturation endonuclease Nob1